MRIAIATENKYVSAHFGRCPSYTLVDIEGEKIIRQDEILNPGHQPGFLPQFLSEKGVELIIAGGMGPRAQALFSQKNIATFVGIQGRVDDVIQDYISQKLESGDDLCDHPKGEHDHCHGEKEAEPQAFTPEIKVCVTALGDSLESEIDPKFGRAAYLIFTDIQMQNMEAVKNPYLEQAHGVGVQTAQLVAGKGVQAVFTGDCGPNARRVLEAAGIQIMTGSSGVVKQVLQKINHEE
jgi:predicted Fe-Mo cluster-binding NifX family protein